MYGPAGVGKSTRAELLQTELSFTAHIGVDRIKRFISEFRTIPSHNKVSKRVINSMASEYLKNNISVIVEQGMTSEEIIVLKEIASTNNANFYVYRFEASREILKERVEERTGRLNKPTIPQEEIDFLYNIYKDNDYPNTRAFDTEKLSSQETVDLILKDLEMN
ncbi:MAG: hypothetical protein JWP09_697 [Candidatus Taylorbacteria bacterium]|nr:hypothetical protein [Candidatus Taylorbacteria bacterium]